ncbi:hypothetical protein [Planktothrix sp. FACHB-1365]|nr:hypothetical protein [Planktothrix sp. FACHB-1365]
MIERLELVLINYNGLQQGVTPTFDGIAFPDEIEINSQKLYAWWD